MNYKETRPWGAFENIADRDDCKVKIITIKPGQQPSYQYHNFRSEIWVVISGTGILTLNELDREVEPGSIVRIPMGGKHTIKNNSETDLIFVEVQLGTYFGEDDIIRITDLYGRV